jgi:hypothetical protein
MPFGCAFARGCPSENSATPFYLPLTRRVKHEKLARGKVEKFALRYESRHDFARDFGHVDVEGIQDKQILLTNNTRARSSKTPRRLRRKFVRRKAKSSR